MSDLPKVYQDLIDKIPEKQRARVRNGLVSHMTFYDKSLPEDPRNLTRWDLLRMKNIGRVFTEALLDQIKLSHSPNISVAERAVDEAWERNW